MSAAAGVTTTGGSPNALVEIQPGMWVQAVVLVDQNGQFIPAPGSVMTTLGDTLYENATPAPARLAGNTSGTKKFLTQTGTGVVSAAPAWGTIVAGDLPAVSGQYLCVPTQYAPDAWTALTTTSTAFGPVTGAASTVAAGSNGGEISQIAAWASPSAGVLDVADGKLFPPGGGTATVATSTTTATITYTGITAGALTGCAYVSGSATGTVSTGGAVTLTSAVVSTGNFTAPASGSVVVTASAYVRISVNADVLALGLAAHGTITPMIGYSVGITGVANEAGGPATVPFIVTGLTPGNVYDFDLMWCVANTFTATMYAQGQTGTSPTLTSSEPYAPVTMTVQAV